MRTRYDCDADNNRDACMTRITDDSILAAEPTVSSSVLKLQTSCLIRIGAVSVSVPTHPKY